MLILKDLKMLNTVPLLSSSLQNIWLEVLHPCRSWAFPLPAFKSSCVICVHMLHRYS